MCTTYKAKEKSLSEFRDMHCPFLNAPTAPCCPCLFILTNI